RLGPRVRAIHRSDDSEIPGLVRIVLLRPRRDRDERMDHADAIVLRLFGRDGLPARASDRRGARQYDESYDPRQQRDAAPVSAHRHQARAVASAGAGGDLTWMGIVVNKIAARFLALAAGCAAPARFA